MSSFDIIILRKPPLLERIKRKSIIYLWLISLNDDNKMDKLATFAKIPEFILTDKWFMLDNLFIIS